jgi:hypothetical protein
MTSQTPPTSETQRDRLVFYPVAGAGFVFCLTVLSIIASAFADPQAPVARWLNAHAISLMLWEAALVVVISVLAMVIDRVRTLRKRQADHDAAAAAEFTGAARESGHVD